MGTPGSNLNRGSRVVCPPKSSAGTPGSNLNRGFRGEFKLNGVMGQGLDPPGLVSLEDPYPLSLFCDKREKTLKLSERGRELRMIKHVHLRFLASRFRETVSII